MPCVVVVFPSYDQAHRTTQHLIEKGVRPRVTYISARASQGADSAEGFYPKVTPYTATPISDDNPANAKDPGTETAIDDRDGPSQEMFTGDFPAGRFAPTGTDNLTVSPPLMARLLDLGLERDACERILALVREGDVAAVYGVDGDPHALLDHLPRDGVSVFLTSGVSLAGG